MRRQVVLAAAVIAFVTTSARQASAFMYGEHHDIGATAVRALSAAEREQLDAMWRGVAGKSRQCATAGDAQASERTKVECFDFGDLPSLAGDHACTRAELRERVRTDDWTLALIARAMRTRRELTGAPSDFVQRWRTSDLDLAMIDAHYSSRAGANDAHFALPRASEHLAHYLYEALSLDAPVLNAVGLYATFHTAALRLAVEAHRATGDEQRDLSERALYSEAFALHFLEDLFSSGHIVGTFGSLAMKKGTHDEYCRVGLDVRTWRGVSYGAHGDAFMRDEDLGHASAAVADSLRQLLAAREGEPSLVERVDSVTLADAERLASLDVCTSTKMPAQAVPHSMWPLLDDVLGQTPVPARMTTLLPRAEAEVGVFFGIMAGLRSSSAVGRTSSNPLETAFADLELSLRFGVGLRDIVGPAADGQFFVEAGTMVGVENISNAPPDPRSVAGETRLLPHQANRFGLRLPFFLVPGDLLVLAPILLPLAPRTLEGMAITASSGGVVPWQRPIATAAGRVQLVLGRKIDFLLYRQRLFDSFGPGASSQVFVHSSYGFGFPVIEWSPFRTFGGKNAYSVVVQLGGAVEVPYGARDLTRQRAWESPETVGQVVLSLNIWGQRYF